MSGWKWCFENSDKSLLVGWQEIEGKWYHFDENGAMNTGWIEIEGKWYYLDTTNGDMKTGWLQDKGNWYYLEEVSNGFKGAMYCDCTATINDKNYTFNSDGVCSESLLSDAGADFIGGWEGFWSKAKYDPYYPYDKRYITIGYGTTYSAMPSVFNSDNPLNTTCTKEEAREWLKSEAKNCAETIKSNLDSKDITLNQNQLDALISFSYNCGTGALLNSTLYKNIVAGVTDTDTITANLRAWSKANGTTSAGLLKRRNAEAKLFLYGDYTGNN